MIGKRSVMKVTMRKPDFFDRLRHVVYCAFELYGSWHVPCRLDFSAALSPACIPGVQYRSESSATKLLESAGLGRNGLGALVHVHRKPHYLLCLVSHCLHVLAGNSGRIKSAAECTGSGGFRMDRDKPV